VQHRNIFSVRSCQEEISIYNTFVGHQRNTSYVVVTAFMKIFSVGKLRDSLHFLWVTERQEIILGAQQVQDPDN
jgi:hypothetical protein